MKKHIGKLVNTDQRVVVVFMQIPERADHALVVSIDNLHPRLEQALLEIVDSKEGQHDPVLANILGRRVLPDTNENVLKALHERQLLRAVHVDQVVMLPQPNMPFPLRGILQSMGRAVPGEVQPEASQAERFNPHANNTAALDDETKVMIARNLIIEADMLAAEAANKREKAYTYAPSLRPAPASYAAPVTLNEVSTTAKATKAPRARKPSTKAAKSA
jgi:hypothetical protein